MLKIGIITIYDNNNYGNRLQNYATQTVLKKIGINNTITIKNKQITNKREKFFLKYRLRQIKRFFLDYKESGETNIRKEYFQEFNENINITDKYLSLLDKNIKKTYNYFITRK